LKLVIVLGEIEVKVNDSTKELLITGIIEVYPGVFVLQLNGKQNEQGLKQSTETLLQHLTEIDPSVVVVDMEHVLKNGRKTERYFTKIINSVQQLGIKIFLATGKSSTYQKLSSLGINSLGIKVCHSMGAGLWMALDIVEPWSTGKSR